jgi:hypothetical protein
MHPERGNLRTGDDHCATGGPPVFPDAPGRDLQMAGRLTWWALPFGFWAIAFPTTIAAAQLRSHFGHYTEPFMGPATYRDPVSGAIIYVESDGMHLARIEKSGKLAWMTNPHSDARVPDYREMAPRIVHIGPMTPWMKKHLTQSARYFITMTFTNSQFGLVDMRTGAFQFLGQD